MLEEQPETHELKLNYVELEASLNKATYIINERPMGVRNPGMGEIVPITTNQLLVNASKDTIPFDTEPSNFNKKLDLINQQFRTWWKNWFAQVFEHLILFNKWKKTHPNITVDTIVFLQYDRRYTKHEYRMACMLEVQARPEQS